MAISKPQLYVVSCFKFCQEKTLKTEQNSFIGPYQALSRVVQVQSALCDLVRHFDRKLLLRLHTSHMHPLCLPPTCTNNDCVERYQSVRFKQVVCVWLKKYKSSASTKVAQLCCMKSYVQCNHLHPFTVLKRF